MKPASKLPSTSSLESSSKASSKSSSKVSSKSSSKTSLKVVSKPASVSTAKPRRQTLAKESSSFAVERAILKELKAVLSDAKAESIEIYDLAAHQKNTYTDFICIATAISTLHLKALAGKAKKTLKSAKINVIGGHKYDPREERWVIVDCGSIVLHLFMKEDRDYYALDDKFLEELKPTQALASPLIVHATDNVEPSSSRVLENASSKVKPAKASKI